MHTSFSVWFMHQIAWRGMPFEDAAAKYSYTAPVDAAEIAQQYFDPTKPVFDIGSGSGLSGKPLLDLGYIVDGIDFSPKLIEQARQKGYRNLAQADIRYDLQSAIPLFDVSYHNILSVGVFGDFLNFKRLSHFEKVMADDATIVIAGMKKKNDKALEVLLDMGFTLDGEVIQRFGFYESDDLSCFSGVPYQFIAASRK